MISLIVAAVVLLGLVIAFSIASELCEEVELFLAWLRRGL